MYGDFKSAYIKLELCEDDSQWIDCLNKATQILISQTIRKLFCEILTNCVPASPSNIYEMFKDDMREDFVRQRGTALNLTEEQVQELAYNDLLHTLNVELQNNRKCNIDFKLAM